MKAFRRVIICFALFTLFTCQKETSYGLPFLKEDFLEVNHSYGRNFYRYYPFICQGPRFRHYSSISLVLKEDASIYAMNNGMVTTVCDTCRRGFGNNIRIQHNDSIAIHYYHLKKVNVALGDLVKKGEKIGVSGKSGYSTKFGLGIKVFLYDCAIDPEEIIAFSTW